MKHYSSLRSALINCVCELTNTQLTGYVVYNGNDMKLANPDYSKEIAVLVGMIDECNERSGLECE